VDASFTPDLKTCKSVTGYLIQHSGDTISWGTKKQNMITTSSTAAEYVAIAKTLPEISLIRYLHGEIYHVENPIHIMEENISTKVIAETGERRRLRHVIIKYYAVQEAVGNRDIILKSIKGTNQYADALTKAVDPEVLKKFLTFIFQCSFVTLFFYFLFLFTLIISIFSFFSVLFVIMITIRIREGC